VLEIREEQVKTLEADAARKFESRMIRHLNQFFPGRCQELGEEKIREMVQRGIRSARTYEIVSERHVCRLIDLLVAFGRDFDAQLSIKEFQAILNDPALKQHPDVKIDRLGELVQEHARKGCSGRDVTNDSGSDAGKEGDEAGDLTAASADAGNSFSDNPPDSLVMSYPAVGVSSATKGK